VGSPKFRSRDGQITTTCQWRIARHLGFEDQERQVGLVGRNNPSSRYSLSFSTGALNK